MSFSRLIEIAVEYAFLFAKRQEATLPTIFSLISANYFRYAVFKVLGGLKWTRTTDLALIRRAL